MHRLRVISFDKVLSEKENDIENSNKNLKKYHNFKIYHKTISTQLDKTKRPKTKTSTNTERKVTQKDNYTGSKAVKKISIASMSEIFRLRTKGNFLKRFSSIKTISLDDIRKTLISNVYGKKPQKTHKQCYKNNASVKKTVQKRRIESQDDIKVLYSFERSKSPDIGKMECNPKKNHSKHSFIRRTSSDIFGIGRIRKNTYLCFHTTRNTGLLPTPKRKKKKTESTPYILHQVYPISIPNRKSKNLRFQKEHSSDHYNVVCFPKGSKINIDSQPRVEHKVAPCPLSAPIASVDHKGDTPKCACAEVRTYPSPIINQKGDTPNCACTEVKTCPSPIINESNVKCIQGKRPCKQQKNKCHTFLLTLKCILKNLIMVISIIVWSPCILAVTLCWLLVYPLKPHYVLEDNEKAQPAAKCTRKSKNKSVLFTRILEFIVKASLRLGTVIYDICPFKNKEESELPKLISSPSQIAIERRDQKTTPTWQPNPEKRYILFFDNERGWLMKPLRREDGEDSPCMKRPEVVQHLGFDRQSLSRSNRTVTFSKTLQEKDGQPVKFREFCKCPPCTLEKSTQAELRATRSRKRDKSISQNDDILELVAEPDQNMEKHKITSSFSKPRPSVTSPPPRLSRPCPMRKYPAHSTSHFQSRARPRVRCQQCRASRECRKRRKPDYHKAPLRYQNTNLFGKRFYNSCKCCARDLNEVVCEAEHAWDSENCKDMYLHTLTKRPCFWIYCCWPSIYPVFLRCLKGCGNLFYALLYLLACLVWCPLFLLCYLIYILYCECCS